MEGKVRPGRQLHEEQLLLSVEEDSTSHNTRAKNHQRIYCSIRPSHAAMQLMMG